MPALDDLRTWCPTDRPGERVAMAAPLPGIQILSVRGSHRHWSEAHDTFTIALVHRDQGDLLAEWRTRCRSVSTAPGGMMLIEPGDVHVTQRFRARAGAADFDVVHVAPTLLSAAAAELGLRGDFHFRTPSAQDPHVFQALEQFIATVAAGESGLGVDAAAAAAVRALLTLGEQPPAFGAPLAPERDYRLRRVSGYLAAHVDRRPTLSELERVSGISQWRLCALFQRSYGTSIGKYWNALRLRRAQRDIESGRSLAMVAAELGYHDEAYLCRVFKARYGVTPGAWREISRRKGGRRAGARRQRALAGGG